MSVVNTAVPVVSDTTPTRGDTIFTTNGSWTFSLDYLTYAYQWYRCLGSMCTPIPGATSASYTVVLADVGYTLMSEVTATEHAGSPPPSVFGGFLPPRLPESTGSTINVASMAALTSAVNTAPTGSIINLTANINGGGAQVNFDRVASSAAPITITSNPGVVISNYSQWYLAQCAYIRFRGLEFTGGDCAIKPTASSHDIEIDGCHIHNMTGQGILVTSSAYNVQIWNCRIHNCGDETNLDHGIYFGYARGDCVIANNLLYDNWAYNLQVYPDCPNIIVTCNTLDGDTPSNPDTRGGMVLGSESGLTTNTKTVGLIGTNAAFFAVRNYHPGSGNNVYDSIGYGNSLGDFEAGTGVTYTNCVHADPLYVNRAAKNFHLQGGSPAIDFVDPARYGYVPPLDIDGNPRVTADAGCYAA